MHPILRLIRASGGGVLLQRDPEGVSHRRLIAGTPDKQKCERENESESIEGEWFA